MEQRNKIQVFQASSARRWQRVKWASRLLIFFFLLLATVFVVALSHEYIPSVPKLKNLAFKKTLLDTSHLIYRNSLLAKKYRGFRQFINEKEILASKASSAHRKILLARAPGSAPVQNTRAAFYVSWDPQSFSSLQRNISKLDLVVPEWFFIDPKTDTVAVAIDARALAVMKNGGADILPMLSNFSPLDKKFHGEAVHRIIHDPVRRERLIKKLLDVLAKNKFQGINIDLEDLKENSDESLIDFQKELYQKLHAQHFIVTQDVVPFNEDYNYKALSSHNDFLFIMAYDEFSPGTRPGPIAEQKWIEAAVDDAIKKIPAEKIILGLPAYGYDWPKEDDVDPHDVAVLTYQAALSTAKDEQAKIEYDNDSYNLHFSYADDDGIPHEVFFTDAATTFNAMRFAHESGLAGVALWRLGSEDERIWQFYGRNMSIDSIRSFDFEKFGNIPVRENVVYTGNGEVLDVVASPKRGGDFVPEIDSSSLLISEENYDSLPVPFVAKKFGWNGKDTIRNRKKLVLTFDDGPDPVYTKQVLAILKKENIPASFFIVGINAENNIPLVKKIYHEGYEIGNHTFTHPNIAEVSQGRAVLEMETTRLLIECITGHSTILFRAPYNADFEPEKMEELVPVAIARRKNYLDIGESIDPLDWEPGITADTIFNRVIRRKLELNASGESGNIILLHDAGGDNRKATVEALPRIIDYFKSRGYSFTTIADLLGKKKDDLMPAVPKGSEYYLIESNYALAEVIFWISHFLFSLFIVFIFLSFSRLLVIAWLADKQAKKEKRTVFANSGNAHPFVSIIVPAYNEEVNIISSLQNLLKINYPSFEIIFIDDGSTDSTYERVRSSFGDCEKLKVLTKPNGGKASALNFGIEQAAADYVICIDADTKLKADAVGQLMKHFTTGSNNPGAVAGKVNVGNEVNFLTRWQSIEYISSQNFDRRAFAFVNAITVVPGAIGAFSKQAIRNAGGFTSDTLAEDCDLTIRILRCGYVVINEPKAIAYTEAPETLKMFIKQRSRWSFGVLQTFWKHIDVLFSRRHKWLGWLAMPNILLFQYIIPFFIPLADLVMVLAILTGNLQQVMMYYIVFMFVDLAVTLIAFRMEKESLWKIAWLIPQRIIWRWLMWYVLFKSVRRAIKGELQSWGVLKRTGNVRDAEIAVTTG